MTIRKAISFLCLFLCLSLLLIGCRVTLWSFTNPTEQPNTIWRSEDGTMEFRISEDGDCAARGTMNVNGETLDVIYNIAPAERSITVYLAEYWDRFSHEGFVAIDLETIKDPTLWATYVDTQVMDLTNLLEDWYCSATSRNSFKVTVQKTTYFQESDIIVFHKVDS